MSYDTTVFIGWYAAVLPTQDKKQIGTKIVRKCSADPAHKHKGSKFCPECGAEIRDVTVPKAKAIALACHFFNETDPEELDFMTNGLATLQDMELLKGSHAIFPEFLSGRYDVSEKSRWEIIMAPGYFKIDPEDGGVVQELTPGNRPSEEWVKTVKRVLGAVDIEIKYGVITEIR